MNAALVSAMSADARPNDSDESAATVNNVFLMGCITTFMADFGNHEKRHLLLVGDFKCLLEIRMISFQYLLRNYESVVTVFVSARD